VSDVVEFLWTVYHCVDETLLPCVGLIWGKSTTKADPAWKKCGMRSTENEKGRELAIIVESQEWEDVD
jgi:hypothetical protein